jgi:DNA-binding NarL/FixJ family response regulator
MAESPSALVIDDEQHVRTFLRTLVQMAGAGKVWEADSGPRGKELYLRHKPTIVLLDLNMAGPTGLAILSQIIESDPDAKVIIVTSQNDRETVLECQRLGATGFLLKSRRKDELLASLKKILTEAEAGG